MASGRSLSLIAPGNSWRTAHRRCRRAWRCTTSLVQLSTPKRDTWRFPSRCSGTVALRDGGVVRYTDTWEEIALMRDDVGAPSAAAEAPIARSHPANGGMLSIVIPI